MFAPQQYARPASDSAHAPSYPTEMLLKLNVVATGTGVKLTVVVPSVGLPGGGAWKTTSVGETWYPVLDDVKDVSSIGAVEVAPSDPNIVYAGTGDMVTGGAVNEGNGIYRSSDAEKTWFHTGLDSTKQIPSILVDPPSERRFLLLPQ